MDKRALFAVGALLAVACRPEDVVHRFGWFSSMVTQRSIKRRAVQTRHDLA